MADSYRGRVREVFDSVAGTYDSRLDGSELNSAMRDRSMRLLQELFRPGFQVVDIGCGTGSEATILAKKGVRVIATDISPAMTSATAKKAGSAGVGDMVETSTVPASGIGRLAEKGMQIDGAYSLSGALNCEPDLGAVAGAIASVLKPHAHLVVSMVNRLCLGEMLLYTAVGRPSKAFRRFAFPAKVAMGDGIELETYLHSLRGAVGAFEKHFELIGAQGMLVFLPPPGLETQWRKLGSLNLPFRRLEDHLSRRSPFSALGDHYLLHFRKAG